MPDLSKSNPPIPPVTPEEMEAQNYLRRVRDLLWFVDWFLLRVHDRLRDPAAAEAMGTGEIPESLSFSIRGAVECARMDYVNPLDELLRRAVKETPKSLARDWQKRQRTGKR